MTNKLAGEYPEITSFTFLLNAYFSCVLSLYNVETLLTSNISQTFVMVVP